MLHLSFRLHKEWPHVQIEQHLFPSLQMFGEDAGSAGAESAEGALQIALARLLPALLKAQVTTACPHMLTMQSLASVTRGLAQRCTSHIA